MIDLFTFETLKLSRHMIIIVFALIVNAQVSYSYNINNDYEFKRNVGIKERKSWIFGGGWHSVDDNGKWFEGLFSVRKVWNTRWFPSQYFAEFFDKKGYWTFGAMASYNLYKTGKEINQSIISGRFPFCSFDLYTKAHLRKVLMLEPQYDLYIPMGVGYTFRAISPYHHAITVNIGLGFTYWINHKIGINIGSWAKFGMRNKFPYSGANYLQHSLSLVYLLDQSPKKRYSRSRARYKWVHDKRKVESLH